MAGCRHHVQDVEFGGGAAECWFGGGSGGSVFVEDGFFFFEGWVAELIPFSEDEDGAGIVASFVGVFVNCD